MQPFFAKASRRKAQREAIHAQHEHSYRKNLFMSICSDTCCSTGELLHNCHAIPVRRHRVVVNSDITSLRAVIERVVRG
jgi:hypothetical protein